MSTLECSTVLFVLFVLLCEIVILPAVLAMVQAIFYAVAVTLLSFSALFLLAVSLFGCQGDNIPSAIPPPQVNSSFPESCQAPYQADSPCRNNACHANKVEEDWDFLGFVAMEDFPPVTEEQTKTHEVCGPAI